ncbi:MAG: KOW domain-containing RNA-binding protein [Clostridiaceae bacterium]|nr:KOW domain-containing RNA-binding protein [Clostridiaceae bacterium]
MDKGTVVISLKGRDKDLLMCVVGVNESGVSVCDGKQRKLSKPKLKNPKHVRALAKRLTAEQMLTDRAIRKALKFISEA